MKRYITEGVGAFFLVLTALLGAGELYPLAVGALWAAVIFVGSGISGAHYNPAFSLAVFLLRRLNRTDFFYYVTAQLAGGLVAALMGRFLLACGAPPQIEALGHVNPICPVVSEFFGAFALTLVWLKALQGSVRPDPVQQGLITGLAAAALIYAFQGISGAVFNPALALGAMITGSLAWADAWIYLLGALLGAAAAYSVFQFITEEKQD